MGKAEGGVEKPTTAAMGCGASKGDAGVATSEEAKPLPPKKVEEPPKEEAKPASKKVEEPPPKNVQVKEDKAVAEDKAVIQGGANVAADPDIQVFITMEDKDGEAVLSVKIQTPFDEVTPPEVVEEDPQRPPLVSMNTDVAACKLQATYRGHGDRKKVEEVKKEKAAVTYEQRANDAAAEIQAAFALYGVESPAAEEIEPPAAEPAPEIEPPAAATGEVKLFEVRIVPQENANPQNDMVQVRITPHE